MDILEEESNEPNSNRNSIIFQNKYIDSLENLKNIQNNTNFQNLLDTSNISTDLLKTSDTTLGSSSCDDGE